MVAVDGSRFRAVNARDRNFTAVTIRRRMEQVDANIARYLGMLDTADRQDGEAAELRTTRLTTRLAEFRRQMRELEAMEAAVAASPERQISLTDPDARAIASAGTGTGLVGYNHQAAVDTDSHIVVARGPQPQPRPHVAGEHGTTGPRGHGRASATPACRFHFAVKANFTTSIERRVKRWEHEEVIEAMQAGWTACRARCVRRRTVEHVFGTIKDWMGRSHLKTRTLKNVATEMRLHVPITSSALSPWSEDRD